MKKGYILFCAFIVLVGCTGAPKVDTLAEADALRNLEEQWIVALNTADVDKIAGFFAAEGVSMMANKPIIEGLQSIREGIVSQFADTSVLFNTYKSTTDVVEVSATGDLAYVRGHDQMTIKTKNGLVQDEGKWVDVWKKVDGQWKVVVTIGNSNKPREYK